MISSRSRDAWKCVSAHFIPSGPIIRTIPVLFLFAMVLMLTPVTGFSAGTDTIPLTYGWKFFFAGADSSGGFAGRNLSAFPPSLPEVSVPHTFPQDRKTRTPLQGFGWYFRELDIPGSCAGKDLSLEFEGASLYAKVFIDGNCCGGNTYPFLPFQVDIPPLSHSNGRIYLAVRVDNRLIRNRLPDYRALGWWDFGGLIREVRFVARPQLRIGSLAIRTMHVSGDTFDLSLRLQAAHEPWDSVHFIANTRDHSHMLRAKLLKQDTTLRFGGVLPWTPETPVLYTIELVPFFHGHPGETLSLCHGFSQLAAVNGKLALNGKPYFLKGFGRHDLLGEKGPLLTRQERLKDLIDIKSIGADFLRIAHFPQHHDIYDLCDSLGLLVMDEIPAWKTDPKFLGSPEGRQAGAGYIRDLITAHGNHTCICMWSAGNQLAGYRSSIADYTAAVSTEAKRTDPSRLVTYCSYYYIWDRACSNVDVIAVNEYFGWELASLGMLGPMLDKINREWPGKPIIVSETGAQSKLGLRNPHPKLAGVISSLVSKDISEDHQALYIGSHLDTIWSRNRYVSGVVVWAYADYFSYLNKARTQDMPQGLNACGMVTIDRKHKLAYNVVKSRYERFKLQPSGPR